MMAAEAKYVHSGRVELRFPFNRPVVETLKSSVPPYARGWDPIRKVWTVDAVWANVGIGVLRAAFGSVRVDRDQHGAPAAPDSIRRGDPAFTTLHLLPTAPACVIEASYRALVKAAHPDRLPTAEQARGHALMVEINAAYERLRALRERRSA